MSRNISRKNLQTKKMPADLLNLNFKEDFSILLSRNFNPKKSSLGFPVGVVFGSSGVTSTAANAKNFLIDCAFVAHAKSSIKHPVKWTEIDVDEILASGRKIKKTDKNIKSFPIVNEFSLRDYHLKISLSEPKVMGKISSAGINLMQGLTYFFSKYQNGIFQTTDLVLYIKKDEIYYIFDSTGRSKTLERSATGKASLIALTGLKNVFHLIVNLSNVDKNAPFKISSIDLMKIDKICPQNPIIVEDYYQKVRPCDIKPLNEELAILSGNLSLNSSLFQKSVNRQHLTSSIVAVVYSKIDPANSWSKRELDNIVKMGTHLYNKLTEKRLYHLLHLNEFPSKFYLENFEIKISIVPDLFCGVFQKKHLFFDNDLCLGLRQVFKDPRIRSVLVEVQSSTFGVWKSRNSEIFYLYDGYEKDEAGEFDAYTGKAHLFITVGLDALCKTFVDRLYNGFDYTGGKIQIHGLFVRKIRKLSVEDVKRKPKIRCDKADDTEVSRNFKRVRETCSIVDYIDLSITKRDQDYLKKKIHEKPIYKRIVDLNTSYHCMKKSPSTTAQDGQANSNSPETSSETKALINSVRSGILATVFNQLQ